MTTGRRRDLLVRTPQDLFEAIDARVRAKQARTKDRVVSRNEVVVTILRLGLQRSTDVAGDTPAGRVLEAAASTTAT